MSRLNLNVPFTLPIRRQGIIRGYVQTTGGGAWTINESLNVSSITDNAVGDLTINWATSLPSATYAVLLSPISTTSLWMSETNSTAKTAALVRCVLQEYNAGATADPTEGVAVMAVANI